jgi:hypothetical protein
MFGLFTCPSMPHKGRYLYGMRGVDSLYNEFKYVMVVSDDLQDNVWCHRDDFDMWCQLNGCYYLYDRVMYVPHFDKWYPNGIGGQDLFFIATNCDEAFMMAKLRWG